MSQCVRTCPGISLLHSKWGTIGKPRWSLVSLASLLSLPLKCHDLWGSALVPTERSVTSLALVPTETHLGQLPLYKHYKFLVCNEVYTFRSVQAYSPEIQACLCSRLF